MKFGKKWPVDREIDMNGDLRGWRVACRRYGPNISSLTLTRILTTKWETPAYKHLVILLQKRSQLVYRTATTLEMRVTKASFKLETKGKKEYTMTAMKERMPRGT